MSASGWLAVVLVAWVVLAFLIGAWFTLTGRGRGES
jgi:hypothetical protein